MPDPRWQSRPRVIAEIQARAASSRLPGKIFADIEGRPMLGRVLDAVRRVRRVDDVVVATTANPADNETQLWCEAQRVACFRGSEHDVLARVTEAVRSMRADVVVQMTGDNPLACPEVIDAQIACFLEQGYDYLGDNIDPSYPVGCGAKIFRAAMLAELNRQCDDPFVREHVSLYFYEHPERYRIGTLRAPENLQWPDLRVTVDEPDDLAFVRAVYERLQVYGENLTYPRLVSIVRETGLNRINQHVRQRPARGRQPAATPRK